ncbi:MAG: hypothetical protein J2P22_13675 [Nocardioides sp.]|nr:hypothetical protein [Nocardioides sp.]
MQPTADSYRALARSSPWRWRTLHFTRHGGLGEVEAWVRRPGRLLVRPADGSLHYVSGAPYSWSPLRSTPGGAVAVDPPTEQEPVLRPDGLVAWRPENWYLEHSDPMWENYTWTAMLDPDELSHHVDVDGVEAGVLRGRDVWSARLRPVEGYDPRCGCCPLLWSEVAAVAEYGEEPDRLARFAAEGYPEAYVVALDVQTGVVVSLEPIGVGPQQLGFSVEIHAVDSDLDAVFAGRD